MIIKKKVIIIIILFLSQFAYFLTAQEYIINISPIVLKNIDTNFTHLANGFPQLLYTELKYTNFHHYSNKELIILKENDLENLKNKNLDILSELKKKYDEYYFSKEFDNKKYQLFENDIIKQKLLIEDLVNSINDNYLSIVPVKYLIGDNNLITTDNKNVETVNLKIKGVMEQLDDWIYIQFWVENLILNTEELIFRSVSSTNDLINLIPEISMKLKTVILGRSWSSLAFNLDPGDTMIVVKNNLGQIPEEGFNNLYPGKYIIELSKQGYITKLLTLELNELETYIIDRTLELEKKTIISLQSFPSGADLYFGATWIGKTPVLIESPIMPTLLTLKHEDYNDSKYIYNELSGRDIQIFMQSSVFDREKIINNKRNIFYRSFSYFLLSIPVSMLSFGISSDYAYAYDREVFTSPETDRLQQLSNTWYNVYLGAMFINITLFVNTIFDLVDYIKSNDFL